MLALKKQISFLEDQNSMLRVHFIDKILANPRGHANQCLVEGPLVAQVGEPENEGAYAQGEPVGAADRGDGPRAEEVQGS
jgi:hypothetical protein